MAEKINIQERRAKAEAELATLKAEAEVMRLERQIKAMQDQADGNLPKPVATISEELLRLQQDMAAMRSGEMTDAAARNVLKAHSLIFRAAELSIAYQRLNRGKFPSETDMRLIPAEASRG